MTHNPLVSIIVRTKDRPIQLKNALSSICKQDYRPLQVIVVNDGGYRLNTQELQSVLPDICLQVVELSTNQGRARAANVGIINSGGEYIGFLDDDDEFLGHHVSTLLQALQGKGEKVAYSKVDFVEKKADEGCTQGSLLHTFGQEYDPDELVIANYIPFISVLIESHLLKSLMIDESFELYEDWDLLIRLSTVSNFVFVDKVTCVYHQHYESQIAFSGDQELVRGCTTKLYAKHQARLPVEKIFTLREICRVQRQEIDQLQHELQSMNNALSLCRSELEAVLNSRTWRLSKPYRELMKWVTRIQRNK